MDGGPCSWNHVVGTLLRRLQPTGRHSSLWSVYNAAMPFRPQGNPNAAKRGRTPPPEETFEEAGFLKALGEKQKPVSVKLMDGQTVSGWIEYYDKHMVRLTREGAPNLFIFKHEIMYIAEDGGKRK
jgi:host factor-I protein